MPGEGGEGSSPRRLSPQGGSQAGSRQVEPAELVEVGADGAVGMLHLADPAANRPRACSRYRSSSVSSALVMARKAHLTICVVGDLAQPQRRCDRTEPVPLQGLCAVEAVVGEQPPAGVGHQADGLDEVAADRLGDEVVGVDPNPAGLGALAARGPRKRRGTVAPPPDCPRSRWPAPTSRTRLPWHSSARITSILTACLSWKTNPALIGSTIAGVPPSSRCTGSVRYACSVGLT